MVDFAEIAALVSETLQAEGISYSVTYTSITPGAYDPATGTTGAATTTTETVPAFEEQFSGKELIAGLVEANDAAIGIMAPDIIATPKPTDTVTINGIVWTVHRLRDLKPGGVGVLHSLHLRRT